MILLIMSGVFLTGLLVGEKLSKPSEPWNNREEHQKFQEKREQWAHGGWIRYR